MKVAEPGTLPEGTIFGFGPVVSRAGQLFAGTGVNAVLLNLAPLFLMIGFFVVVGIVVAIAAFAFRSGGSPPAPGPLLLIPIGVVAVAVIVFFIWLQLRVQAATLLMMRRWLFERRTPGIIEAFGAARGHAAPLFWTILIQSFLYVGLALAAFAIGFVLEQTTHESLLAVLVPASLAVPAAFFLFLRLCVALPVVVYEGRNGIDALRRSSELVRGNGLVTFAIFLVVGGALGGCLLVITVILALVGMVIPILPNIVETVVQTIFGVFFTSLVVSLYYGLLSSPAILGGGGEGPS